ncbi:hypothetical protein KZ483_07055 [Paenibacillus sp. sptzw28]|uniref:hypothetical protein n=1 Tax=Paenibacillus sp. sptzw28 TaxID=715179 RepID=UPI001C6DD667|nr:hypothetical protein [Paenibacillus sp. sptzw28]QYR22699.1 hypothetical protein KZ483_07055 [Paenibacillus sp. sptzw28]
MVNTQNGKAEEQQEAAAIPYAEEKRDSQYDKAPESEGYHKKLDGPNRPSV